ncbi:MAG TPA: gamma-glutamyl-gamma-aminobutyrate hydrolase family protein [Candidatus Limnocylindrales bacterium]|nr:gamma-glutamyl-gamma-aminobutyrate hydrolase family protein [Candidatus Limnocylindrales bacterium]
MRSRPRVVVTVAVPGRQSEPDVAERKNELYAAAIRRHDGEPIVIDAGTDERTRRDAFAAMDGLLLTGGADVDPSRYGATVQGATGMEPERDALEAAAFQAAEDKALPILGICRGLQALNVFCGGKLIQDVPGHAGPSWGRGNPLRHPLRIAPGTRLARILFPTNARGGVIEVNSYHHQGIRVADLAPTLVPNAFATSSVGELVEGVETRSGRFVVGLQCHPERQDSTPEAFERVFRVFVDACRGTVVERDG